MDKLTLTPDQEEAFQEFKDFLESDETFKTLKGYAGTGKTTLLNSFVNHALGSKENAFGKRPKRKVAVTATTNKAVKVLSEKIEAEDIRLSTIHSLLNIKVKRKGSVEIFEPIDWNESDITEFDLVIIDECSMISSQDASEERPSLLSLIKNQVAFTHTKVLFCGDPAQLQPINETVSKCFDFSPSVLTKIVRHDDGIASVAKQVREKSTYLNITDLLNPPDVQEASLDEAKELFKGFRENPDRVRLLTWTNKSVHIWNRNLRFVDYGKRMPDFVIGDYIIANEPCFKLHPDGREEILMMNSEEGKIIRISETEKAWKLGVKRTFGGEVTLKVVKKSYEPDLNRYLNSLANTKEWGKFWAVKKQYHDVRHCYAMTVHKSQGSTFDSVVVDTSDIYSNRDILNRNQLLYVAITRAAKTVYLL